MTDTTTTTPPVLLVLPAAPGSVIRGGDEFADDGDAHVAIRGVDGLWRADDTIGAVDDEGIRRHFPKFEVLATRAQTAIEVIHEVVEQAQVRTDHSVTIGRVRLRDIAVSFGVPDGRN